MALAKADKLGALYKRLPFRDSLFLFCKFIFRNVRISLGFLRKIRTDLQLLMAVVHRYVAQISHRSHVAWLSTLG